MKLIFLGSGSAFTLGNNNFQSNLLFHVNNEKNLLLDCGTDIRFSLQEAGFNYKNISDVYISHLHADHVGGMEYLAINSYFDPDINKPNLYLSDLLVDNLWNNVLSGGLSTLQNKIVSLDTYFSVHVVEKNQSFVWENISFQLVQTLHYMNSFVIAPSFGLFFTINGKNVFITSDTQFFPNCFLSFYQSADIIFHDCQTLPARCAIHAQYHELQTLPEDIRGKMWLYHYDSERGHNAVKDGFLGFVKKGQVFDL